jgi:hypothetical protein
LGLIKKQSNKIKTCCFISVLFSPHCSESLHSLKITIFATPKLYFSFFLNKFSSLKFRLKNMLLNDEQVEVFPCC